MPSGYPYPDHVPQLNAAARQLIESGAIAHLVTINEDGSPQVSIVWAAVDGDDLLIASLDEHRKHGNIRRDPRVAVSFETSVTNEHGLREYLVVHGSAEVTEGGAPELLQRLAKIYIGPEAVFPGPGAPPGYLTRITITRIHGIGDWSTT
jgi:PPOX class probable F420-dependent enzyme